MIVIGYQKLVNDEEVVDVVFEEHEDRDDAEDALSRLVETEADLEGLINYFWAIKHDDGHKIMAIKDRTSEG
jgi:quinol monooxygenase YgiN